MIVAEFVCGRLGLADMVCGRYDIDQEYRHKNHIAIYCRML